jgi:hypothetical protein
LIFAKIVESQKKNLIVYCRNHGVTITNTQLKVYFVYLLFNYWSSRKIKFEIVQLCFLNKQIFNKEVLIIINPRYCR